MFKKVGGDRAQINKSEDKILITGSYRVRRKSMWSAEEVERFVNGYSDVAMAVTYTVAYKQTAVMVTIEEKTSHLTVCNVLNET